MPPPPELHKAHRQNDRAVTEAYGMPIKGTMESSCVALSSPDGSR